MTMVEKVARAIAKERWSHVPSIAEYGWPGLIGEARAAIEAMRDIPPGMYDAYCCDNMWKDMDSTTVWKTWIDAALNEKA